MSTISAPRPRRRPMVTTAAIALGDANLVADPTGALFWPERETLVVADLHLEKGSRYARDGQFLPPYDTRTTIGRLASALARLRPRRVVCLGDSIDDDDGPARVHADDRAAIRALVSGHDWIWLCGNHDPRPPVGWGGSARDVFELGEIVLRHDALAATHSAEISGHYHPKASIRTRGRRLSARCFIFDRRRLILPAFGTYTGGLNVLDPAISGLFPGGFDVVLLGRGRLHRASAGALVP